MRRKTLMLDYELLKTARELTGIRNTNAIVHEALKTLVRLGSARRLAALGGTMPKLKRIPRRRYA